MSAISNYYMKGETMAFYKRHYIIMFFCSFSLCFTFEGFICQTLAVEESSQTIRDVPEDEMPIILEMISSDISQNYESIRTWSGDIEKKTTRILTGSLAKDLFKNAADANGEAPEVIRQKSENKIKFVVDANKDFVYVDTLRDKPSRYLDYNNGAEIGNSGPIPTLSTVIAKPNFILRSDAHSFEKGTGRLIHKRAVKIPSKREQQTGWYKLENVWDPRRSFFTGANFTWDNIKWTIKRLSRYGKIEFDGYKFKMEEIKIGDKVEYKIIKPSVLDMERSKPEHYVIQTMIFSGKYGNNMIYWEAATGNGTVFQKYTWEYELVDSVYLPKRVTIKLYGPKGEVTREYDSIFVNNQVNKEIPPGTFEPTNLNLKDGDILVDKISKKEYKYEESTKTFELLEKQK